jgi:hypothetical protein
MARTPSVYATTFAELLNAKFESHLGETFGVAAGNKYDKITIERDGVARSVHCFVTKTGEVLKAAGWNAPAKGVRFTNVLEAAEKADRFGSYLYL